MYKRWGLVFVAVLAAACEEDKGDDSNAGDDAADADDIADGDEVVPDAAEPMLYEPDVDVEIESMELVDRISYVDVLGVARTVNIKVYRPVTGGPYPLVVLSHGGADGFVSAANSMDKWADVIARAGYVAVALAHQGRDVTSYDDLCGHLGVPTDPPGYRCGIKINFDRPNDIDAVLDHIEARRNGEGWDIVDFDRIAHAGHSAGGGAAMAVSGAGRNYKCAQPFGFMQGVAVACDPADLVVQAEPRIDAVLALSPQGPGTDGFMTESFSTVQVPVMMASGASDGDPGEPETRVQVFDNLPASDPHWKIYIDDPAAIHVLFEGEIERCSDLSSEARCTEMRSWLYSAGLAFLDAQLKDSADADAWLASGAVEALSAGDATLEAAP